MRGEFRYDKAPVIDGLKLHVPAGKWLGIIGPNGAGKSTLLKLISGLLEPENGEQRATSIGQRATSSEHQTASSETGTHGSNKTLARIKAKIESAKRYPRLAKMMKIEGRPPSLLQRPHPPRDKI